VRYRLHSYRHGVELLETVPEYQPLWAEILAAIDAMTDARLAQHFRDNHEGEAKSISKSLNALLDTNLVAAQWKRQSRIFADSEYGDRTWKLDFAKRIAPPENADERDVREVTGVSVEVAFNHGGNIAWNLVKPVIASEINHVKKAIQTSIGIVIAATDDFKVNGGFDNAVGSYEKYVSHLKPLRTMLTVPLVIIGLEPCESFHIRHTMRDNAKRGWIEWNEGCEPLIPERTAPVPELPLEELG
jgi:hypothetical protein